MGLDQTFWLDTYSMEETAQPMAVDSNRDAQDMRKGSKSAHRRGSNAPKGKAEGTGKKEAPTARQDQETS